MVIGTSVALPFELSCTSPNARGPLSFFGLGFFCWGGISGSSSCALLETGKARSESAMTPVIQARYKILLHAARGKILRRALLMSDLDFPGREIGMNIHDKAPEFTLQD